MDETRAWTCLGLNLLALPGLGSFLVGRRIVGVAQAVVALAGAALCLWWLVLIARQWMEEGIYPIDGGESFRVGVIGVGVFAVGWVWSLVTSLEVIRTMHAASHGDTETRRTKQRDTEDTEKSTEDTEKTERERFRQKRGESHTRARTSDFLVTGTDTGVGKTVVAAALVVALRARGRRAIGFKPVETGVEPGAVSDSALLERASESGGALAKPLLSLHEALAPAVAADRSGVTASGPLIEGRARALQQRFDAVVVEGAGGVGVPLAWGYTALDLASALGLSAVVVARPGLGTLNHVWLTVEALRARGVPVTAVVLNGVSPNPDLAEQTNPAALARMLPDVRCLTLPRQDSRDPWEVASRLAPLIASIIE